VKKNKKNIPMIKFWGKIIVALTGIKNLSIRDSINVFHHHLLKARKIVQGLDIPEDEKAFLNMFFDGVQKLLDLVSLNSKNSSIPPSASGGEDSKEPKNNNGGSNGSGAKKNSGGQLNHAGTTLVRQEPTQTVSLSIDKRKLKGLKYTVLEPEVRQVVDLEINKIVTDYVAEKIRLEDGRIITAQFPSNVNAPIQYGSGVCGLVTICNTMLMVSYERTAIFLATFQIPISEGTVFNILKRSHESLAPFNCIARDHILKEEVLHADETGIHINKVNYWLHTISGSKWVLQYVHKNRGIKAIESFKILTQFTGFLIHDFLQTYFKLECEHGMCVVHLIRELQWCVEHRVKWAAEMIFFLYRIKEESEVAKLTKKDKEYYHAEYKKIVAKGKKELSKVNPLLIGNKAKNLLNRFNDYEKEILRFMDEEMVPFSNNLAERDLRMAKVKMKVSGCFRSKIGAGIFARIRSFILTCQRHGVNAYTAIMELLNTGKLPDFCRSD
jgi:transposase